MTGTCKLCRELILAPWPIVMGPDGSNAEFLAFAEEMRKHMALRHKDHLALLGGLLHLAARYLSSLFADLETSPKAQSEQDGLRDFLVSQIEGMEVAVRLRPEGGQPSGPAAA